MVCVCGEGGVRGQCVCRHHCAYHSKRHIFGKNDATDNVAEAKADVGLYDHVTSKLQQSAKMTMTSFVVWQHGKHYPSYMKLFGAYQ